MKSYKTFILLGVKFTRTQSAMTPLLSKSVLGAECCRCGKGLSCCTVCSDPSSCSGQATAGCCHLQWGLPKCSPNNLWLFVFFPNFYKRAIFSSPVLSGIVFSFRTCDGWSFVPWVASALCGPWPGPLSQLSLFSGLGELIFASSHFSWFTLLLCLIIFSIKFSIKFLRNYV